MGGGANLSVVLIVFCLGLNLENPDSLAAQAKDYATQYGDSFLYFYNYVVDKSRGIQSQ